MSAYRALSSCGPPAGSGTDQMKDIPAGRQSDKRVTTASRRTSPISTNPVEHHQFGPPAILAHVFDTGLVSADEAAVVAAIEEWAASEARSAARRLAAIGGSERNGRRMTYLATLIVVVPPPTSRCPDRRTRRSGGAGGGADGWCGVSDAGWCHGHSRAAGDSLTLGLFASKRHWSEVDERTVRPTPVRWPSRWRLYKLSTHENKGVILKIWQPTEPATILFVHQLVPDVQHL